MSSCYFHFFQMSNQDPIHKTNRQSKISTHTVSFVLEGKDMKRLGYIFSIDRSSHDKSFRFNRR